jgi:hypothetical protein
MSDFSAAPAPSPKDKPPATTCAVATAQLGPFQSKGGTPVIDEFWGGFAAMLVAFPSAIAFGVTIYGPLGQSYSALGAIRGNRRDLPHSDLSRVQSAAPNG